MRHRPFLTPDPFHTLVVYPPALSLKERRNAAIPVPAVFRGQIHNALDKQRFILGHTRVVSLNGSWLFKNPTGPPLAHSKLLADAIHGSAATCRAQKFPRDTSLRIAMSKACSATSFFNRWFSFSISLNRLAWSISSPPYYRRQR